MTLSPLEKFDRAVRSGDVPRARELLEKHRDIRGKINDPRFDYDSPAIHQAKKNLAMVDVLLEFGADINARSTHWAGGFGILEYDMTLDEARPLMERGAKLTAWDAAGLGLRDELQTILSANPAVVREKGGDGKTVLHCATSLEIVEMLVAAGAEVDARCTDHNSTALQYRIGDEKIARFLMARSAHIDIFAAARWGDGQRVEQCLRDVPGCGEARINNTPPFTGPGLHIYGWTLGFDLTPADVARKFAHPEVAELILSQLSPKARLIDALWCGDETRTREELSRNPTLIQSLSPGEKTLLAAAAWWYRPEAVRLMLEVGFDPHVPGTHRSTPLDRASFHGYADLVEMLLMRDPNPPLTFKNEFGGIPLGACIYGSLHGWKTGFPQDHARTIQLLLEAGSPLDPTVLPTGNDELDTVLRAWLKKAAH